MRVLVIGSGGREHALVWKLRHSPSVTEVVVAPGNGGMALEQGAGAPVRLRPVAADDVAGLVALAVEEQADLVVPGPELPLTLGIADALKAAGVACFGPDKYCAQLEGSKAFAKEVMRRGHVPTADCRVFTDAAAARAHIRERGAPLVVKADGLAAGKGVVVAHSVDEALAAVDSIMGDRAFGAAGDTLVVEDFLAGEEASFLCFCDGERAVPLPSAQDHKAALDGDLGPNTGGMGAYSPAPILPDSQAAAMADTVIRPILRVLREDGHPFVGVLYAGLMLTGQGPRVLEYNVRFGDPECQPLLMRLQGDLAAIMLACVEGRLDTVEVRYTAQTALGVVLAAQGYPGAYPRGMEITGLEAAGALPGVKVFHSGTSYADGVLRAQGGRVLCVTALGDDLAAAQANAYAALRVVRMDRAQFRTDIGMKGINHLRGESGR